MTLVSVIINNFNYGRFLADAIESVLAQTYSPIELIVVDDGSTDESRAILRAYADRFKAQPAENLRATAPKVILQENGGQGSAMNAGFAASSGELIHFLDSDDFLHANAIAEAVRMWVPSAAKLHFPLEVIDEAGASTGVRNPSNTLDRGDLVTQLVLKGEYNCPPTTGNLFARSVLMSILPMDPEKWRTGSDTYLVYHAPFFGSVVAIDQPLASYRAHSSSVSNLSSLGNSALTRLRFLLGLDVKRRALLEAVCTVRSLNLSPQAVTETWSHLKLCLAIARLTPASQLPRGGRALPLLFRIFRSLRTNKEVAPRLRFIFAAWSVALAVSPDRFVPRLIQIGFDSVSRGATLTGIGRRQVHTETAG